MKPRHNLTAFLLGVLATLVVLGLAIPALAAASKTIEVFTGVKIYVDDVELHPTDANGNPVDVFIYDGTTYLPARAVSEAAGKMIQWEGATQSVYIGKHSSDSPVAYLSDLDYFTETTTFVVNAVTKDNLGNEHAHSIYTYYGNGYGYRIYKLNGQFGRLTALFYQQYEARNSNNNATVVIYGDGKELWSGSVDRTKEPIDIDIDLTGVLELKLEFPRGDSTTTSNAALGEVALWA